ncbi:MAG: IPTL-CTERM sorting domain-containing protein [Acidobacteria bacterium]|nr:IPTL-CTERM sorting domain-containing protein [Acidobacteriota bacterium]
MRLIKLSVLFIVTTALCFGQPETLSPISSGYVPGEPSELRGAFLWDQISTALPGVIDTFVSQEGNASEASLTARGADDFIVPGGIGGWDVTTVRAVGTVFLCTPGPCSIPSFNVDFYANNAGSPANSPMFSYTGLSYTTSPFGSLTIYDINIPSTFFPPGSYWVSVQARNDFCPVGDPMCTMSANGIFGWAEAGQGPGFTTPFMGTNPSHWINPVGGWGQGCTSWGRRDADCGLGTTAPAVPPVSPDNAFALGGSEVTCVVNSITIDGPNSVTVYGSPGCVVDVYFSANCGYGTIDPMDPNVTYVGTVTIGVGGFVTLSTAVENDVCYYVTFPGGGPVLAVSFRSVPTLSQWMVVMFALLLCGAAIMTAQRRKKSLI